jgi:hypothetical protein
MKLQTLPARQGVVWIKLGIGTFFKQPLALGGLFFMFIGLVSVMALVPILGTGMALIVIPAATLGLMVATLEALRGKFPMPAVLFTGFRSGQERMRAMLALGCFYTGAVLLLMVITTVVDGGQFAKLYLLGGSVKKEMLDNTSFGTAALLGMFLYIPISLAFWHSPALVHWYQVPPTKALFFSWMACTRNFGAYFLFGMGWFGVMSLAMLTLSLASLAVGSLVAILSLPVMLMLAAMFFSSLYFSFRDSFVHTEDSAQDVNPNPS